MRNQIVPRANITAKPPKEIITPAVSTFSPAKKLALLIVDKFYHKELKVSLATLYRIIKLHIQISGSENS